MPGLMLLWVLIQESKLLGKDELIYKNLEGGEPEIFNAETKEHKVLIRLSGYITLDILLFLVKILIVKNLSIFLI